MITEKRKKNQDRHKDVRALKAPKGETPVGDAPKKLSRPLCWFQKLDCNQMVPTSPQRPGLLGHREREILIFFKYIPSLRYPYTRWVESQYHRNQIKRVRQKACLGRVTMYLSLARERLSRYEGEEVGRREEINQRTHMYICTTNGQGQQCAEGLQWGRGWEEGGKG